MTVKIKLPNGPVREFPAGVTLSEVARQLAPDRAREALGALLDGRLVDLHMPLPDGGERELRLLTAADPETLPLLRHSTSHIMADAVRRLFPEAKLAIGPAIAEGFYYDFEVPEPFTPEDLARVEKVMEELIAARSPFQRLEAPRQQALQAAEQQGETYKAELIRDLRDDTVTFYQHGSFRDLCAGPHLPDTGRVKAFKLLRSAGAYWRGDSRNKMLQRLYGTAFASKKELRAHLTRMEEAKRRDHRRLGRELELFSFHAEAPGLPFFLPKGAVVFQELIDYLRAELRRRGYVEVRTPLMMTEDLWRRSGHMDHYQQNMYFSEVEGRQFVIRPMNCPGHVLLYKHSKKSYRELPLRMAEFGLVHRNELSGVVHGLMRVRGFYQDDAHVFCTPAQLGDEIIDLIELSESLYKLFGFDYDVELSTRPEKCTGTVAMWEQATTALREALQKKDLPYKLNEGEGAFYGPKIDFHVRDAIGRTWQCGTIQVDFSMPERFELEYIGSDGAAHRPVMVHRTIYGSLERFLGVLIEHTAGELPLWLAPVQARVLPITDAQGAYARKVAERLEAEGFRVEVDGSSERVNYKIRRATMQKLPLMLVVGDREVQSETVAVRERRKGDLGARPLEEVIADLRRRIAERT